MMAGQATILFFLTLCYPRLAYAKFLIVYKGVATDGRDTCTFNLTQDQITNRSSCRAIFRCIMEELDNYDQSILSSGSAILAFIPTVLTLLGSTNDDLIRIHAEYPILALLLSISNIGTASAHISGIRPVWTRQTTNLQVGSSSDAQRGDLGLYDYIIPPTRRPLDSLTAMIAYHIVALVGAIIVLWQTIDLGQKAVLTWACWTSFYPALWVLLGVLHYILAVCCLRLSLYDNAAPRNKFLGVWQPKLTAPELELRLDHPKFAH